MTCIGICPRAHPCTLSVRVMCVVALPRHMQMSSQACAGTELALDAVHLCEQQNAAARLDEVVSCVWRGNECARAQLACAAARRATVCA